MTIDTERRALLSLPAAVALATMLPLPTSARVNGSAAKPPLNLDDPQVNLDSMIRIYGSTDGSVRYNVGYGRAFALFDGELVVPLFDARALQWVRFMRRTDGSYDRKTGFVQLHDAIDTGSAAGWRNPVTGEAIVLPVFTNDFNEAHFTVTGVETPPAMEVRGNEPPGKPRIYPWIVLDDDVWLAKEDFATYLSKREGRRLSENANRIYHTSLRALSGTRPSVPATMVESALSELFGWLKMPKDKKGIMLWRFTSKKYDRFADVPPGLISDIRERAPAFIAALAKA